MGGGTISIDPVALVEIDLLRGELEAEDDRMVACRSGRRERDAELELVVDRRQLLVGKLELAGEERLVDDLLGAIGDGDEIRHVPLRRAGAGPTALAKEGNREIDGDARLVVFAAGLHVIDAGDENDIAEVAPGAVLKLDHPAEVAHHLNARAGALVLLFEHGTGG